MSEQNQNDPTTPPTGIAESIKTGLDPVWNEDARAILIALIRSGAPGAPAVTSAIQAADALAEARRERGGMRKEDSRETFAEMLALAPAATEALVEFIKAMKKLDKED